MIGTPKIFITPATPTTFTLSENITKVGHLQEENNQPKMNRRPTYLSINIGKPTPPDVETNSSETNPITEPNKNHTLKDQLSLASEQKTETTHNKSTNNTTTTPLEFQIFQLKETDKPVKRPDDPIPEFMTLKLRKTKTSGSVESNDTTANTQEQSTNTKKRKKFHEKLKPFQINDDKNQGT